jgi:hypothetical protein
VVAQFAEKMLAMGGVYIGENTRRVEGAFPNQFYLDLKLESLISLGFCEEDQILGRYKTKPFWGEGEETDSAPVSHGPTT